MTAIIKSEIISDITQADGRRSVIEYHYTDAGDVLVESYLAEPGLDTGIILNARAFNINDEYARRDSELAEAMNFEIPLTKDVIIDRIAQNGLLGPFYTSADPGVSMARLVFDKRSGAIYRKHPLTIQMMSLIQSGLKLTDEQIAGILA